jgi:succinate dehydrogenase / fumarate reductase cytochrome b subunit
MSDKKVKEPKPRPLSPHLQAYNMFAITSLTSILHRMTGAALVAGSLIVVWWLLAIAHGAAAYDKFLTCFHCCIIQLILVGFSWAFWYHFINGLRHLTWDTGRGLKRDTARLTGKIIILASLLATAAMWAYLWSL